MDIKTNHHWRPALYWYDLTTKEQAEFDYLDTPEDASFIRYKGVVYDVGGIMRIDRERECLPDGFNGWQGYVSDSFFSGVLFCFSHDCESVQCATYFS